MQIKNEKPPIYDKAKAAFDFNEKTTIFTYDGCIYNPAGINVTLDLQAHEQVHERQQEALHLGKFVRNGASRWWKRYLKDADFRFQQELEAYQEQYRFATRNIKDRNQLNEYLTSLARQLKGPMYGDLQIGGLYDVMALIRNGHKAH